MISIKTISNNQSFLSLINKIPKQLFSSFNFNLGEIPKALQNIHPSSITTLPNGIRVCIQSWNTSMASIGVFINTGSRYEALNASGSAHFLEHILFKGTKKRSKHKFEYEIEQIGSSLNAYTSREHTLFSMECFPENTGHSLSVLGDMLQNSLIHKQSIQEEKETIKAELMNCYQDPIELIMEMGHRSAFGSESTMGRPILGEIRNIDSVTKEMVREFHLNQYTGDNMVIVATGNVNSKLILEDVNKYFGKLNRYRGNSSFNPPSKPKFKHNNMIYVYHNDHNYQFPTIGTFFQAPGWLHDDYYPLIVIERLFGQYNGIDTIPLIPNINNNKITRISALENLFANFPGILKHKSVYNPYRDCGLFGLITQCHQNLMNGMNLLNSLFPKFYLKDINELEINRAKAKVYQELLNIQSPLNALYLLGPQILYLNRVISPAEIAKKISMINKAMLVKAINTYFNSKINPPVYAYYGPKSKLNELTSGIGFNTKQYLLNSLNTL